MGCFETEALSGPMIESMHREGDLLRRDEIKAQLLREELPDEAVHVLVGTTLPRGVEMREVKVGSEPLCDPFMFGELATVVGRQRMNASLDRCEHRDHGIRHNLGSLVLDVSDQRIARLTFVERHERLLMDGTDNQIGLPITEATARIDNGWTLLNRHLIRDDAPVTSTIAFRRAFWQRKAWCKLPPARRSI